jgi:hypothetical protein
VAVVAVNTDRSASRDVAISTKAERYTLASAAGLLSHDIEMNGKPLALGKEGAVPALSGTLAPAGPVSLPPASITFLTFAEAGNTPCQGR